MAGVERQRAPSTQKLGARLRLDPSHPVLESSNLELLYYVIPAQAGNQNAREHWIPAFAGMTEIAALAVSKKLFPD